MALLKDDELIPLLTGSKSIVAGLPQPPTLPTPPGVQPRTLGMGLNRQSSLPRWISILARSSCRE